MHLPIGDKDIYVIEQVTTLIEQYSLGNWASILGLFASLIGFYMTIRNVKKSKTAAEAATEAARSLKSDISAYQTVTNFTETLGAMSEIKRLHRSQEWHFLPEKCDNIRKSLITIRCQNGALTEADNKTIQSVITHFKTLEQAIDQYLLDETPDNTGNIDVPRNNRLVSTQIDKIQELLERFNSQIGN